MSGKVWRTVVKHTYAILISKPQLLFLNCFVHCHALIVCQQVFFHLYVTVCCGFPPGSETDRNGLSMLSNELSPVLSPGSKVRTQFLIGQVLNS